MTPPRLTETELKVMRLLWERGELKPAQFQEHYPEKIRNNALRGLLTVLGIFALGIVFGIALSFVLVHHVIRPAFLSARHGGPLPIERLTRRLDLDAAQQNKIRQILERGHAKMRDVLDETRKDVRAELRPDQQERFDRIHPRELPR